MKGKFEEKLVKLAFGELGPRESAALEKRAQADPEAGKLHSEYREMHSDLDLLMDVPPDQFSKERLRDAILGQGLKPIPTREPSRWGWTWMPASAFALVFGFLTVRHLNTAAPKIIQPASSPVAFSTAANTKRLHDLDFKPQTRNSVSVVAIHSSAKAELKTHEASKHVLHEKVLNDTGFLAENSFSVAPAADRVVSLVTPPKSASKSTAGKKADSGDSTVDGPAKLASASKPMVVINPEKDNESGAQKAAEVDSASNAVFGG